MHDFIAIGDIVSDAFIRLQDASVHCDINRDHCTLSMAFGDKIPYEFVEVVRAVGNSANASVSAARLGLSSALVANLGDDQNGKECMAALEGNKVDVSFMKMHVGMETNYHYVLWFEDDRTILVKHQPYKYELPDIDDPKWVYLSSLGENTKDYHHEIARYLAMHSDINLAFQPGTFQMKLGTEELKDIYARSKIFFCNIEEAERILGIHTLGIQELLKRMHALGPEIVVLTDGPKGAYSFDGNEMWFLPVYPDPKPPYERTGAGDAFSSTCVAALALGKDIPTALAWGAINSMSVVQFIGAQKGLLTQDKIEQYLANAPASFKPTRL